MKHSNVAIFVPHNGCPHQCSFCNQRSITGKAAQPTPDDVAETLQNAVGFLGDQAANAEIAFFGGSFTAIEESYMISLLNAAKPYIVRFKGIRISTRPDAVNDRILTLLKSFGVTSIELGAQSMNDEVLRMNDRGHSAEDVRTASELIRNRGFELGLQMMTGLYGSTADTDLSTAHAFAKLHPDTVRIYPTVVMKGTRLAELYQNGSYCPPSLDDTVALCAELLSFFEGQGIRVIRVGLHHSASLETDMLAGPYHPAFRELIESTILLEKLKQQLSSAGKSSFTVRVNPQSVSVFVGNKKKNLHILEELGYQIQMIQDETVPKRDFLLI